MMGRFCEARIRPDGSSSLYPVHDRHLHIHQHGVVVVLLRHSDCNLAVLCQIDLNRGIFKQADCDFLVDLVVFDQQHARPARSIDFERRSNLDMTSRLLVGMENSNDCVEKGRRSDGLDKYVLKAIFLGLFQHILAAIGGHHHEVRRDREIGQCKNALAGFDAIEH